jgi:hypothetical protein
MGDRIVPEVRRVARLSLPGATGEARLPAPLK